MEVSGDEPGIIAQEDPMSDPVVLSSRSVHDGRVVKLSIEEVLLPNGNTATLTLPYVTTNQSGVYSVAVSNSPGGIASTNAQITISGR
jgi:hypothetical protein